MLLFYVDTISKRSLKIIGAVWRHPSTRPTLLNLCLMLLCFCVSAALRLGSDIETLSSEAIFLNLVLAMLIGLSVSVAQVFYPVRMFNSTFVSATTFSILFLPLMFFIPDEWTLPTSTLFINWFVMVILLQISQKFHFKSPNIEEDVIVSGPRTIEELVQRPPLTVDRKLLQNTLKDQRILILGAGGSFGLELIQQINTAKPSCIGLVDNNETQLLNSHLEVKDIAPKLKTEVFLGDVCSRDRIRHIISSFKPDVVFHDATLKQIPIGEANLAQAILTNVIGTQNVADACRDFKVKIMLYISCHEAGIPTHAIGVTKRLAEGYCLALDKLEKKKLYGTRFLVVRLGNLLDSMGSVVPVFKRQIKKGVPLTVTHPEVVRHFMHTSEAVELALQAMALGVNADKKAGSLFALEKGEPIKIAELAEHMIRIEGKKAKIEYIGLRQGEKLTEAYSQERMQATQNPHISMIHSKVMDHGFLVRALRELEQVANNQDKESIMRILLALVPEYKKQDIKMESPIQAVG